MELLTLEDVAEIFKVSPYTVKGWLSNKKLPGAVIFNLPGSKGRGTRRFIKSKLEDWVNGNLQT